MFTTDFSWDLLGMGILWGYPDILVTIPSGKLT